MKLIDIKNLTYEYFRRDAEGNVEEVVEALSDVSLKVEQGEFVAILGKNGSGKSTLAKHLNALLMPGEGQVIVDGMDTTDHEVWLDIRQVAGMVFQNPDNQIVANVVEEDVGFGPENIGVPTKEIWNRVEQALTDVEMQAYRNQSPNHLSGGQKQRVAIAGVLAMNPKCIIFDEATAMLDPRGRKQMIAVAKELKEKKGITIILITHHMEEAMQADRVYVMNNGNIEIEGTPIDVFEKSDILKKCGLCLPTFLEYMHFMMKQEILSEEECRNITCKDELENVILSKFDVKKDQNGILKRNKSSYKDDVQSDNRLTGLQNNNQGISGLIVDHISYRYNRDDANKVDALKNVSVVIGKGEFVAIIGHTGSGKSTLMQHLNGLLLPTTGTVYFDGQDITEKDFSMSKLRQKVGMVFQYPEYQLFAETVEKDVCFGPENMKMPKVEAQKRAYEAIAAVGLPDTIYDCSPLQLSGGQKRRVAIAGVLAMHPDYLILDEPTAGLEPVAAKELMHMLKQLQVEQGITVVIVSHDMEQVAEYADRVVVMDQGEKKYDDKVSNVFQHIEELETMGLDIPFGIKILNGLKCVNDEVDVHAYRMLDVCGELLKLKNI